MVRLRFAPAPTGHLYLVGARFAILNWLFACHYNGNFVLRIADLLATRSAKKYSRLIMNDLKWLGISWDEGPDLGGKFYPYNQANRLEIYRNFAEKLISEGQAYRCFCLPVNENFESTGEFPPCENSCRNLVYSNTSKPSFLRLTTSAASFRYQDIIKGLQSFNARRVADFVIFQPDFKPTQDFADAIDDALMQITHVILEEDSFESTIRQLVILQALDLSAPTYTHIANLVNADGTMIYPGRRGMSIEHFREAGYLATTLVNYFGRCDSLRHIRSLKRLIEEFELKKVAQVSSVLDIEQLNQLNSTRIRHMKDDVFLEHAAYYLRLVNIDLEKQPEYKNIVLFLKENINRFSQIPRLTMLFMKETVQPINEKATELLRQESTERICWSFLRELNNLNTMTAQSFRESMRSLQQQLGLMGRELWGPINVALTGQLDNIELARFAEFIGLEKCEKRIRHAIAVGRRLRIEQPDRSNRYMRKKKA